MARIGVAGFLHETNTFANDITTFAHFAQADAWPGLLTGPSLLSETQGMTMAVSGFIAAIDQSRHSLVPWLWCWANPAGPGENSRSAEGTDGKAGVREGTLLGRTCSKK